MCVAHTASLSIFAGLCRKLLKVELLVSTFLVDVEARHLLRGDEGSHGLIADHLRGSPRLCTLVGEMLG